MRNPDHDTLLVFYNCPVCGRYELGQKNYTTVKFTNEDHVAHYLFYHCFKPGNDRELRYNTILSKEKCDAYKTKADQGDTSQGRPVHMDDEIVEGWYPKSLHERINYILLYLANNTNHLGQKISISNAEMLSLLFVDRKETRDIENISAKKGFWRGPDACNKEAYFMLDSLKEESLITYSFISNAQGGIIEIGLTPKGYARVDEIEKNTAHGRSVLVAMKFGEETNALREAIRKGVKDAGYVAVFIDEVQHNDYITPELLKHIRDSKFVVVDLTHQNNGAYFEEGYAMGLGKPVIQLCKKETVLHFDIAQKNTIFWSDEDDIPERLTNRIRATIE